MSGLQWSEGSSLSFIKVCFQIKTVCVRFDKIKIVVLVVADFCPDGLIFWRTV